MRFKATAGLHHAIRAGDAHGFLNVLAAAVFAYADGLSADELVPLLAEEDAAAFTVDAGGLALHDHRADAGADRRGAPRPVRRLRLVLVRRAGRGPHGAGGAAGMTNVRPPIRFP